MAKHTHAPRCPSFIWFDHVQVELQHPTTVVAIRSPLLSHLYLQLWLSTKSFKCLTKYNTRSLENWCILQDFPWIDPCIFIKLLYGRARLFLILIGKLISRIPALAMFAPCAKLLFCKENQIGLRFSYKLSHLSITVHLLLPGNFSLASAFQLRSMHFSVIHCWDIGTFWRRNSSPSCLVSFERTPFTVCFSRFRVLREKLHERTAFEIRTTTSGVSKCSCKWLFEAFYEEKKLILQLILRLKRNLK